MRGAATRSYYSPKSGDLAIQRNQLQARANCSTRRPDCMVVVSPSSGRYSNTGDLYVRRPCGLTVAVTLLATSVLLGLPAIAGAHERRVGTVRLPTRDQIRCAGRLPATGEPCRLYRAFRVRRGQLRAPSAANPRRSTELRLYRGVLRS
jgi:hypothetical protein